MAVSDGKMRAYALLCTALFGVFAVLITAPAASASETFASAVAPDLSFADLLGLWFSAMTDPATYTTTGHMSGFFDFLRNDTFLSAFSSDTFGSLSRNDVLGNIQNIFFAVCIVCILLSIAVAVLEIKKVDTLNRVVKKLDSFSTVRK